MCWVEIARVLLGISFTCTTLAECLQEPLGDDSCSVDARYKAGHWLPNAASYMHDAVSLIVVDSPHELAVTVTLCHAQGIESEC